MGENAMIDEKNMLTRMMRLSYEVQLKVSLCQ